MEQLLVRRGWVGYLLSGILTLLGLAYVIGPFLWAPNAHLYGFGGDAFVIYYDVLWHALHGAAGTSLDAMLYPRQELIYLTDAEGLLAVVLQWISRNVIDLSSYAVGIIHSTNNAAVVLCGVLSYHVAIRLGASRTSAFLLAPVVVLLSPQMLRIGGHFGLAYPFSIPLAIAWLLRMRSVPDWKDALITLAFLALTFNNPYVGFSAGLSLGLACFIGLLLDRQRRARYLIAGSGMTLALLLPFLYFKALDPFTDRMKLQWGAFEFRTSLIDSFIPTGSMLKRWLSASHPVSEFESAQYLGIVAILAFVVWLSLKLIFWVAKQPQPPELVTIPRQRWAWLSFVIASTAVYLLCYRWDIAPSTQLLIEQQARALLMFKAAARLAWPFYFAFAFGGVLVVSALARMVATRAAWLGAAVLVVATALGALDVVRYFSTRYENVFDNYLSTQQLDAVAADAAALGVDTDVYQAMILLPRQLSWNGNVMVEWDWSSHFSGVQISLATGLPMVNANLGRAPLQPLLDVTQLMSRPLVPRGVLPQLFPDDRPLLLVLGDSPPPLSAGEQFVLSVADSVGHLSRSTVYSVKPSTLVKAQQAYVAELLQADSTSRHQPLAHVSFDNDLTPLSYSVPGALLSGPGETPLLDYTVPDSVSGWVVASVWVRNTAERYGLGAVFLESFSAEGKLLSSDSREVRRAVDTQGMWMWAEAGLEVVPGGRVVVRHRGTQALYFDDVLLRVAEGVTLIEQSDGVLINGVKN